MKHPAEASAEPTQTPNVTRALPPVVWSARGSGYRTNNYIRSNPYRTVRLKTYHLLSQLPRGLQGNRISDRTEIFVQALLQPSGYRAAPWSSPCFKESVKWPRVLTDAMAKGGAAAKRVFEAMMPMKKIDVAAIEAAVRG